MSKQYKNGVKSMKKAALHNLGCKVNSYEMDFMQQKLIEKGYKIVPFDTVADIYIVNTCTVTNIADRKSRQMLHRAKQLNPEAIVVAVGCYVQTGLEEIQRDACVDLCIGNNRKAGIADILERFLEEKTSGKNGAGEDQQAVQPPEGMTRKEGASEERAPEGGGEEDGVRSNSLPKGDMPADKTLGNTTVIDINHTDEYEEMTVNATAEHTRAYIKIQDGCNQFCSYCAIPLARGRVRSRRGEDILEEIRGIVQNGYKEIVLTGIHLSSYGVDFSGKNAVYDGQSYLVDLLEQIDRVEGLERIRLSSLEPRIITEKTVERLKKLDKLCPHFHLSLQSGCDETLKRMNRHYTTGEYFDSVKILRKNFEHPAITTDIIVGFPGETKEEFQTSRDFIQKVGFYETHVFKFSKRDKTRAARMPMQVDDRVKTERSNELLELSRHNAALFRQYYIGKTAEVLFEEKKSIGGREYFVGHTRDYVKIALDAEGCGDLSNRTVDVKAEAMLADGILRGGLA